MSTYRFSSTDAGIVLIIDGDGECRASCMASALPENAVILPAEALPLAMVTSVTMRQARLALLGVGLLDEVNAAVAAMSGAAGDAARIEWEFSSSVERTRPLVGQLGAALGLNEAAIDDLFRTAATL